MKLLPAALLAVLLIHAGCSRSAPSASEVQAGKAITVATETVKASVTPRYQDVTATVRPVERATIAARVMGRIERIHVPIGGRARAGDPLVTLQADEIQARLEQAKAQLDQVTRDLARETTLVGQGASSAETARALEDRRRAAAASVNEASALWSYTTLTAPFDGVVTRRAAEVGDLAVPGTALLELEGLGPLRAEAEVPESFALLTPGSTITVRLDDVEVAGTLAELSPAADPMSRTRLAKVELPASAPARSGQFVRIRWPAGENHSLLAPVSAVTRFGQMERVWVVSDGRVNLRLVRTGAQSGDRIELLSGVTAGEILVVNPTASLRDGQPVNLAP